MSSYMVTYFPRVHTALAEWLILIAFICPLNIKEITFKQIAVSFLFLVTMLTTFVTMETLDAQGLLWTLFMFLGAAQMFLLIYLNNRHNWAKSLYRWARAFLVAELAASLEWQINFYLYERGAITSLSQTYIFMGIVYAAFFILTVLHRRKNKASHSGYISKREAISAVSVAAGAFIISNIQFALSGSFTAIPFSDGVLSARTLVDAGGVLMLYANSEQRRQMYLRYELDTMAGLFQRQYEQYQQLDANNEAMRRVYHDLKHQIGYLEAETNMDKRKVHLKEMKEIIRTNESKVNTGNSVLDTILTGKSLICADEEIVMTCYADAKSIEFIDIMDVCSIFGNTIDNAIEYERTIENPMDRIIKVYVSTRGAFSLIRIENYLKNPVKFEGENPVTTKKDKQLHGLGLKNVRQSVEKYDGHISLEQTNTWFTVSILIPLPQP